MTLSETINKIFIKKDNDIEIDKDFLEKLSVTIHDEKRFRHSLSVGKLCYEVALGNNLKNPLNYYLAGILHDVGKNLDKAASYEIMDKYYRSYLDLPPFSYHQFVGEFIIMKDFCIFDKDILDATKFHCTGVDNMTPMEKIVYACDKIDPLRGYDSSNLIELMKKDFNKGFIEVLKENYKFLINKKGDLNSILNRLSKQCFNYYLSTNLEGK